MCQLSGIKIYVFESFFLIPIVGRAALNIRTPAESCEWRPRLEKVEKKATKARTPSSDRVRTTLLLLPKTPLKICVIVILNY